MPKFKVCPISEKYTDMAYYNSIIRNPEYFEKEKGISFRIEYMTPDEYLHRCYEIHKEEASKYGYRFDYTYDEYIKSLIDEKLARKYANLLREGKELPLPVLDYKDLLQEGRHRAYACKLAGYEKLPVMIVYPSKSF